MVIHEQLFQLQIVGLYQFDISVCTDATRASESKSCHAILDKAAYLDPEGGFLATEHCGG